MLTRIIATFAALTVIGLIALVAALPITAQSGDDSSGAGAAAPTATATPTPTPTPTPAPGPTSFALKPHIDNLKPRGLTRFGDKWYVSGIQGHRVFIFSDNGTYERSFPISGCEPHDIRGLSTDGNGNLVAASGFSQSAIGIWPPQPQADPISSPAFLTMMRFPAPPSGGYTANGVAHDRDSTTWVAVSWPRTAGPNRNTKHALLKLNTTTGAHIGTYRMNKGVSGLTYENGNLYALSDGNIVMAVASHLKTSPATWVNNWEVVKRDSGLHHGLAFRDGTAYGFNAAQDEVRAESGSPTIVAAPASPAGVTSPTGADPSDAAAPAPNPATPSGTAPNPSG